MNKADNNLIDISLVIPAFNEAEFLPRLLDSVEVARASYRHGAERIEVIVADNDSTDTTAQIANDRGCHVAHVKKRRIAASRNGGAAIARGTVVAFCDADFRISPETFNYIDSVIESPHFIGGATGIDMERWSLGIAITWWLILPPLLMLGIDGGVWFCRRDDFNELGGYDETRMIGEDVDLLLRLRKLGKTRRPRQRLANRSSTKRLNIPCARVINSTRKFDKHGEWHVIADVTKVLIQSIFDRRKFSQYAQRYWYDDRAEKADAEETDV